MEKIPITELTAAVAEAAGISQVKAKQAIKGMVTFIRAKTAEGKQVPLVGLGKFYPAGRKPRQVNNMHTGKIIDVPAKTVLAFKASSKFKEL
jgi:DNA-binding protein HU-beta